MWRKLVVALLFFLLATGHAAAQEKSYSAERFDVAVSIAEDGSLLVTETVTFDFQGGPFTFVYRELETDLTDGVTVLEASVDGRVLASGAEPGQVEISGRDPVRVEWHMEPFSNQTRTFELSYRMLGVVQQRETADLLLYQPLPDDYEYTIESSTVTFSYPPRAEISDEVRVTTANGQWQQFENQVVVTAQDLGPEETLIVEIRFAPGSLITTAPAWQQEQAAQRATGPLWLAAAGAVFALGAVALLALYSRYRPATPQPPRLVFEPPSDLPPAIAGVINGNGAEPAWSNALATLFDLADRGVLAIEELPKGGWFRSRDFVIRQLAEPADPRPHERGLLDALFETKRGRTEEVKLSELSKRMSSGQWKRFAEPLKEEVKESGFISERRKKARGRMIGVGVLLILLSVGVAITAAIVDNMWILAPAASTFFLGLLVSIAGGMLSALTDEGAAEAAVWQRFADHLKDVTKGKAAISGPAMFQRFLPYAASYGLLEAWAKWFEKEGWTELPPYFHALARADDGGVAAFVAMAGASGSSGGSAAGAAGAAGAGAAGGGGSGAG